MILNTFQSLTIVCQKITQTKSRKHRRLDNSPHGHQKQLFKFPSHFTVLEKKTTKVGHNKKRKHCGRMANMRGVRDIFIGGKRKELFCV